MPLATFYYFIISVVSLTTRPLVLPTISYYALYHPLPSPPQAPHTAFAAPLSAACIHSPYSPDYRNF